MAEKPRADEATPRPRRQKPVAGNVFLIPLSDGTCSLGQVLEMTPHVLNSILCAMFHRRGTRPQIEAALPDEREIVSVQFVTPESLKKGFWPIVRNDVVLTDANRYLPMGELASKGWVGAEIMGSANIGALMNAYFGLCPWDNWYEPDFLDGLLARGVARPGSAILVNVFRTAVIRGDAEQVQRELDNGATVDSVDGVGKTPLMHAVIAGNDAIAGLLINAGANTNIQDAGGNTALHLAAHGFHTACASRLLSAGAVIDVSNEYGDTPLGMAVLNSRGRGDLVSILLAHGADRHAKNKRGRSPLQIAKSIKEFDVKGFFNT